MHPSKMSADQLTELIKALQVELDSRFPTQSEREAVSTSTPRDWQVGDRIVVDHKTTHGKIFTITKVNRVTVKAIDGLAIGRTYSISK